jgi:hypothetical protein
MRNVCEAHSKSMILIRYFIDYQITDAQGRLRSFEPPAFVLSECDLKYRAIIRCASCWPQIGRSDNFCNCDTGLAILYHSKLPSLRSLCVNCLAEMHNRAGKEKSEIRDLVQERNLYTKGARCVGSIWRHDKDAKWYCQYCSIQIRMNYSKMD